MWPQNSAMLPQDLKNYTAPDAFQIMEPSLAFDLFWLAIIVACFIL